MELRRGKFISFEGIEGSGKTTQQRRLAAWLEGRGIRCLQTKEPGGTEIGQKIREILLHPIHDVMSPACETLLYLADRAQHHVAVIAPALERGEWVICDRYHDSTLAYQGVARGMARPDLDAMFRLATGELRPDMTILLDLDPAHGLGRAHARNHETGLAETEGRFEAENLAFHRSVRQAFLDLARAEPNRFVKLNADREPDVIAVEVAEIVEKRMVGALV